MRAEWTLVAVAAAGATAVYATFSLLLHRSFHTSGWDLGIFDQVIWNTSQGRWFEYSFRDISYAGDHWQPALVLLVPVKWLWTGPEPLLIAQAAALGASVVTLYGLARATVGRPAAWYIAGAWALSVGVGRAVAYDFHLDPFAPALIFGALWAAVAGRPWPFALTALGTLLLKEDMGLVVLALSWLAWFAAGLRRSAVAVAAVGFVYSAISMSFLIPHYRGDDVSPLVERYGYLGDTGFAVAVGALLRPDLVVERLMRAGPIEAVLLVLLSGGLVAALRPKLLVAVGLVTVPALLSESQVQASLGQHYLAVPTAVAVGAAVLALRDGVPAWIPGRWRPPASVIAPAWFGVAVVLWVWRSALPPSLAADAEGFRVDDHSRLQRAFVEMMPAEAPVSAQSAFVPHLSEREDIYEFPRVLDAEAVLVEPGGSIPAHDLEGYSECLAALPKLGFDLVRDEGGIQLWRKARAAEPAPEAPRSCTGGDPPLVEGTPAGASLS